DQRSLAWAFRSRNYSAAPTARLAYNAEALHPLDQASLVSFGGAYGGKAIGHSSLRTEWTPVLDNTMSGAYPTHVGLYDVWARVYSSAAYPPWIRFVYGVGDLVDPTENDPVRLPGSLNFYLVNLGQVDLRKAPIGPHRWIGMVQGRGTGSSLFSISGYIENLYVDRLWYLPAEEGSGVLRASSSFQVGSTLIGGDDFNQPEVKPLGGQVAESGGSWVKKGTSATDFETTGEQKLKRTAVLDTGSAPSALDTLSGLTFQQPQAVSVEVESTYLGSTQFGVVARYRNNTNYLLAHFASGTFDAYFWVTKVVEGTSTTIAAKTANTFRPNQPIEIALSVSESGVFRATAASAGTSIFVEGSDPELGPSGTTFGLPYGTVGLYDKYTDSYPSTRTFRNFVVWEPVDDAVLFAGREARLTSDGHFRSPDGVVFGPVANAGGALPRIPVSGAEDRPVEMLVKPSRGDFAQVPDSGIDRAVGQLSYRPCWSYVPEEA
ncbi:MAG TPA: hypothetical protein VGV69_11100, partial [Solirubrobacterales bacterium]|nr:hypothetical protein [Solirubrobacterales bacterium]